MRLERIERAAWTAAAKLRAEIAELVAPSYVDASSLLEREFAHNEILFSARDEGGTMVAFFMVSRESLQADGQEVEGVYLGLSATSQATKGSGAARLVYGAFIEEGLEWERALGRRLLLWGTTATPFAYNAACLLFADVNPRPDGTYSAEYARFVGPVRRTFGLAENSNGTHPFVLPRVADDTRYSPLEEERIARARTAKQFALFDHLRVDERQGDRLLLLCRLPLRADPG